MKKTNEQRIAELERRSDELAQVVRFGTVTTVDAVNMTARVSFDNGMRSAELSVLRNGSGWLPTVGQRVITLHRSEGSGAGYILGAVT